MKAAPPPPVPVPDYEIAFAILSGCYWNAKTWNVHNPSKEGRQLYRSMADEWYLWEHGRWYSVNVYKPETDEQWERTDDAT